MAAPQRILIRGVNWLGDAVMTTPALYRLREVFPDAHFTLLTTAKLAGLWQHHTLIDAVMTSEKSESVGQVARRLRAERFDIALVLPNSTRSALEAWLAGIPCRVGSGGRGRRWLLTHPVWPRPEAQSMRKRTPAEIRALAALSPEEEQRASSPENRPMVPERGHHIFQYLHLTAALGASTLPVAPFLTVTDQAVSDLKTRFELDGSRASLPLFGLNPGAEYGMAKRWPEERFLAAATEIATRVPCRWVVLGGRGDIENATRLACALQENIERRAGQNGAASDQCVWNLAGKTELHELCAALKACDVVLTNDTGPMHVAAAVGTPVVVPFGSTSPELTGPGLPGETRHHLLLPRAACAPCYLRECPIDFRCMKSISVAQVVEAVLSAYQGASQETMANSI